MELELTQEKSGKELESGINYTRIASSKEFKQIISDKKKFIIPYTIFYLAYSLLLPFLALDTDILNFRVVGDITLAWVYGISFIPVSLTICSIYVKKSTQFDLQAKKILENEGL